MNNEPNSPRSSLSTLDIAESTAEKVSSFWETARLWLTQAWRISLLMGRGAYLTNERRTLFGKLGEDVYYKILKGELRSGELESVVKEIDRLTKKLEISELKIRSIRFGHRTRTPSPTTPEVKQPGESND
jgi:hypothetical protein